MKKMISGVISGAIAISSLTTMLSNASSINKTNILNISSKSINEDLVLEDGNVIPAGAVALTVNISNNEGFDSSATKLCIEDADYLVDKNGNPIILKGELLNNSIIAGAIKDNNIVVSSASAVEANSDGDMFTVFVSTSPSDVVAFDISNSPICDNQNNTRSTRYTYYIGDVNNDISYIDAVDASQLLHALELYDSGNQYAFLPVSYANANLSTYFPYLDFAEAADTNKNGYIESTDANNILAFYSYVAVGHTWDEAYSFFSLVYNYCSEFVCIII